MILPEDMGVDTGGGRRKDEYQYMASQCFEGRMLGWTGVNFGNPRRVSEFEPLSKVADDLPIVDTLPYRNLR